MLSKTTRPTNSTNIDIRTQDSRAETELYQAILKLKSIEECQAFIHDLCTPQEIKAMADRFHVAKILDEEQLSYREIHHKTGISLVTIGRVARFLSQEAYQGYRLILDRLKSEKVLS